MRPTGGDTFVQLGFPTLRGSIAGMRIQAKSDREGVFAALATAAEQELGAFVQVVSDSFGVEQAERAADDWLEELESTELPDELTPHFWRTITILSATRLAERLNGAASNTKVSPIRSSNCSVPEALA